MVDLKSSRTARAPLRSRAVVVILVLVGIVFLLCFAKTPIMRLVAKHPTAFQYTMKGKAWLDQMGLLKAGNDTHPSEAKDLPGNIEIVVDLSQSKGQYHQFWGGFGYNSFKAGSLNPMNQRLFQMMVEANKRNPGTFNYIRAFNIFTNGVAVTPFGEGCEIYSEDARGNPQFNWQVCDQVFDYIVSMGFDIVVDFTLMPMELASNKTRLQPWFGGNMSPPMSHEKWANLVYETTKHLVERYGLERVSNWYFEVWNEPDLAWLFWIADTDNPDSRLREWGDMDAYNKLYDYTADAVKRAHPDLWVGGPAVAGAYIEPFLEHQEKKNYLTGKKGTPVDFLSFHSYGSVFEKVINKIDEIHRTAGSINKVYQHLPYIISEFSPSPYDLPWYVSRYPAIWLIAAVDAIFNYADQCQRPDFLPRMMIYWTSPVIKDFGEDAVNKETDGLATTLGNNLFKLPVFNAFEMLGYLSNERVRVINSIPFPDYKENLENEFVNLLSAIATRSDSSFEVLVYQFTENDAFSQKKKEYQIKLNIKNIPDTGYYLRKFALNEYEGNSYRAWKRLNSPSILNPNQVEILEKSDDLNLTAPAYQPDIVTGVYFEELTLQTNTAILLVFSKQLDDVAPLPPTRMVTQKVTATTVRLEWQAPPPARDGDLAAGYEVFENQKLAARFFRNQYSSENLMDNTSYHYQIYSLDAWGNKSIAPLSITIKTEKDDRPPKLLAMNIQNAGALELQFDEPLDLSSALQLDNYQLSDDIAIESVSIDPDGKTVHLKTGAHKKGKQYTLTIGTLRDRAKQPNELQNYQIEYRFLLKFEDQFDFDNLNAYIWKNIWEEGGTGSFKFDAVGKRLLVTTGDDVGESFSRPLPESSGGDFQLDFQPIQNYPEGGRIVLKLKQSEDTFYQIENTHGYGPGFIKKVVSGFTVDSTACSQEFQQGQKYRIQVSFSPGETNLNGFKETVKIEKNNAPILVKEFEIQLLQQDAYFDNIYYESR